MSRRAPFLTDEIQRGQRETMGHRKVALWPSDETRRCQNLDPLPSFYRDFGMQYFCWNDFARGSPWNQHVDPHLKGEPSDRES